PHPPSLPSTTLFRSTDSSIATQYCHRLPASRRPNGGWPEVVPDAVAGQRPGRLAHCLSNQSFSALSSLEWEQLRERSRSHLRQRSEEHTSELQSRFD